MRTYSCLGPSGAGLHQALDRPANRPGSQRPRGQEGARRSNTQAHSDPLRTGTVRGPEHRTSNIEAPTSNIERRGKATQSHTLVKVESRKQKVESRVPSWNRLSPMERNSGERKAGIRYSEAFKMALVRELEEGGRAEERSEEHTS